MSAISTVRAITAVTTLAVTILAASLFLVAGTALVAQPCLSQSHKQASSQAPVPSLNSGILYYSEKDYAKARQVFAQHYTTSATACYYLALCNMQLGARDKALELFTYITKRWPSSDEAKQAGPAIISLLAPAPAKKEEPAASKSALSDIPAPISKEEWDKLPAKTRIPISREHGHMMVNAKINGRYCKVAFDTGASLTGISILDYPEVFSEDQLLKAKQSFVQRPFGAAEVRVMSAEISLQDITRKVQVFAIREAGVSVIGQNFFREYSYMADPYYIRLTKAPYNAEDTSNTLASKQAPKKPPDKFCLPFEKEHDVMLVDIDVNGYKSKAIFDTGCAADGLVAHPSFYLAAGVKGMPFGRGTAERVTIGHMIKTYVPVYPGNGLRYPLIGPRLFDRPFTVDQQEKLIRFDY